MKISEPLEALIRRKVDSVSLHPSDREIQDREWNELFATTVAVDGEEVVFDIRRVDDHRGLQVRYSAKDARTMLTVALDMISSSPIGTGTEKGSEQR